MNFQAIISDLQLTIQLRILSLGDVTSSRGIRFEDVKSLSEGLLHLELESALVEVLLQSLTILNWKVTKLLTFQLIYLNLKTAMAAPNCMLEFIA